MFEPTPHGVEWITDKGPYLLPDWLSGGLLDVFQANPGAASRKLFNDLWDARNACDAPDAPSPIQSAQGA